jgi:AcrR family transcriptional regulator
MSDSQRTRTARAIANDAAIRDSAISEILRVGVDRVSLRDVGKHAGLTHGATYARYEDVNELLVDLWESKLRLSAIAMFERSVEAVEAPNEKTVHALFDLIREARPEDVAMVQVLLISRRIPILYEEVEPFIKNYLEPDEDLTLHSSAIFTRALTLFSLAMVRVFTDSQFGADCAFHEALERVLVATLNIDPANVALIEAYTRDEADVLAPDDDFQAQLAYSTYDAVGKSGYHGATISRIARRADCSPGAIYKSHSSKEDLVVAAFRDIVGSRWIHVSDFVDILEEGNMSKLLHYEASDHNALRRNFTLEAVLAAAHNEKLRDTVLGQLRELEALIPGLVVVDDTEKECLAHMVRSISSVAVGVSWLASITKTAESLDFNQFAEPFRLALLSDCVPTWDQISQQIRALAANASAQRSRVAP